MLGDLLLLGCIYVQPQFTQTWLDSLPLLEYGVLTHQLFDKSGCCKNYVFRLPRSNVGKSENSHLFPDPQFSITVSTNDSFGLINKFTTKVIPLPFHYNTLITRPYRQCNFSVYQRKYKTKSYYKKKRFGRDLIYKRARLYSKYYYYLISICPTIRSQSTRNSTENSTSGLLNSLYPYRLGYIDSEAGGLTDSELYFNIFITNNNSNSWILALGIRLGVAIIASAILYNFV